jgi:hypothetical protein
MLDEMLGGPGEEEYARLDAWLDDDDDDETRAGFAPLDDDGEDIDDRPDAITNEQNDDNALSGSRPRAMGRTFDDDFDDFAAFQSAPPGPPTLHGGQHLTPDPTPLLLHLQSVRAELAGMDEEERRTRAGQEVARVMRDLGFDDIDASDLLAVDDADVGVSSQ